MGEGTERMIDEEFNKNVQARIGIEAVLTATDGMKTVDEYIGKWDELLEDREKSKRSCEKLLSLPAEELTEETQEKLAEFRNTEYPIVLCRLGRCYMAQDRYAEAKEVLQEAADLGFRGAKMLLGLAYINDISAVDRTSSNAEIEAAWSNYKTAYSLLLDAGVLSEGAERQVENAIYYKCIVSLLGALHRDVGKNLAASYDTYTYMLQYDWGEAFNDQYHAEAQEELSHFSKSIFGKLKYR